MIRNFSDENTIINKYIAELRHPEIQEDRLRFRKNLERLAGIMAYEVSKTLSYRETEVDTPLGIADVSVPDEDIIVSSILRAGTPMHHGILEIFDHADSAFISSFRKHHKDGSFEVNLQYVTCPDLNDKILILADPMLATGSSFRSAYESLKEYGKPKKVHFLTAIAAQDGIDSLNRLFPEVSIWAAAIDEELTAKSYIVPGLGDAGDLCYGPKLQK